MIPHKHYLQPKTFLEKILNRIFLRDRTSKIKKTVLNSSRIFERRNERSLLKVHYLRKKFKDDTWIECLDYVNENKQFLILKGSEENLPKKIQKWMHESGLFYFDGSGGVYSLEFPKAYIKLAVPIEDFGEESDWYLVISNNEKFLEDVNPDELSLRGTSFFIKNPY